MTDFKVGDQVRRIAGLNEYAKDVGHVFTVTGVHSNGNIQTDGRTGLTKTNFELVSTSSGLERTEAQIIKDIVASAPVWPGEKPRDPKEKDTNPKAAIGVRKVPFSVIPMDVMAEVGLAMLEGSAKYGRHNYRAAGARASVYFDGTMRHLIQWWEGEDTDPDAKGVNHITKAIASLTVLRAAMLAGKFEDDRPPRTGIDWPALNEQAAAIIDMHAAKSPKHYTEKQ